MTAIAEHFASIAGWIEQGRADAGLLELLAQARAVCAQSAAAAPAQTQRQLGQLQQALETWQTVWPRLGSQQEFRLAVTREARLWAKRLARQGGVP